MWDKRQLIEIPLMFSYFAIILTGSVDTNFIIYRTCYTELNNSEVSCAKLGSNMKDNSSDELELKVEPYSNIIIMVLHTMNGIVPAISCLFIGPWSDTHGRKPIMLIGSLGCICSFFIRIIITLIPSASTWFLLLQVIPTLLSGGFITFIMICMCYVVDVTAKENIGTRIGFMEIIMAISLISGSALSSFLFNATGYSLVFVVCLLVSIVAFLYIYFFIEDTTVMTKEIKDDKNIFSLAHLKDIISTVSQTRPNNGRTILYILVVISLCNSIIMSHISIMFPFMRLKFKWTLEKFTLFTSIYACINIIGTFFGIYILHKLLKLSETVLLLIVYINHAAACVFILKANSDIFLFIGMGLQFLNGVMSPMMRSLVSKMVPNEEVGKIFSFVTSVDCIAGLLGSPIFTFIYNSTIDTYPAAFFIVDTAIYVVNIILVGIIWKITRMHQDASSSTMNLTEVHDSSFIKHHDAQTGSMDMK